MTTEAAEHVLDDTAQRFLASLAGHGIVSAAAADAGISPQAAYKRRAKDDHFARLWDSALDQARERIAAALKRSASDQDTAARMLAEVADRLRNPDLPSDDRATHLRHLQALGERIDELKALASSEAAKAYTRRRDEARGQLRDDANTAVAVAAEFDLVVKELDPHWKRLLHALDAMRQRAVRAEVECPEVALHTLVRCAFFFHCPQFAAFLGLQRPDRRHQQEFATFLAQRIPAEVRR